ANALAAHVVVKRQQFLRREQHTGRAKAALQGVARFECLLQIGKLAGIGDALDRFDLGPRALRGEHQAAAHHHAIHAYRACTAGTVLAADMTAGKPEIVAQENDQRLARLDRGLHRFAIDGELDRAECAAHRRASPNCWTTRRSSTPAKCRLNAPLPCKSSGGSRSDASAATAAST